MYHRAIDKKTEDLNKIRDILDNAQVQAVIGFEEKETGIDAAEIFHNKCRHFHGEQKFYEFLQSFYRQKELEESSDSHLSLELGSGLGTWSLHTAALGIQSYGVEQYQVMVNKGRKAAEKASERGIIQSESLCQYTQGDITEKDPWEFQDDSDIGIEDATIIYACLPSNETSIEVYSKIAENMDEEAVAILPESIDSEVEDYFEATDLSEISENYLENPERSREWIYNLKNRPSSI